MREQNSGNQKPSMSQGHPVSRRGLLVGAGAIVVIGGGAIIGIRQFTRDSATDSVEEARKPVAPAQDTTPQDTAPQDTPSQDGFDVQKALAPRIIGSSSANIRIVEYFSLSCGHCANFHIGTFVKLREEWIDTGKARFEYRDFPLGGTTVFAHALARAVPHEAYETMLGILFAQRDKWLQSPAELFAIARNAGIGRAEFEAITRNRAYLEGIVAIAQEGSNRWGVNSTPSFVINDSKDIVSGNLPYDEFVSALRGREI